MGKNQVRNIDCEYFTSNKSLECWIVKNNNRERIFFIFNYKGIVYSVYNSIENFQDEKYIFKTSFEPDINFPSEDENTASYLENERIYDSISSFLESYRI